MSHFQISKNTDYQNSPFSAQILVSGESTQLTSTNKRGWMTIYTTGTVHIGPSGVSDSDGFRLDSTLPSTTVSAHNLSKWYAYGPSGGTYLYLLGAYID